MRAANIASAARRLESDGTNLSAVFATLPRAIQVAVGAELARLVGVVRDVDSRPHESAGDGKVVLQFLDRWKDDLWLIPSQVSDGTLIFLAFLTLQHQSPQVDVIAIEEPERGLHPYLVGELIGFLRNMSQGKIGGRAVQIVMATHSPLVLNHLLPEEVRFMRRDATTGDVVVDTPPVGDAQFQHAFEVYEKELGGMWLSGGMSGVPD